MIPSDSGFRWLLGSNFLQFLCFQILSLAMIWLLTDLTDSRTTIGLVGMVQGGSAFLFSPIGGVIVCSVANALSASVTAMFGGSGGGLLAL